MKSAFAWLAVVTVLAALCSIEGRNLLGPSLAVTVTGSGSSYASYTTSDGKTKSISAGGNGDASWSSDGWKSGPSSSRSSSFSSTPFGGPSGCSCGDRKPPGRYQCWEQKNFGKCEKWWMKLGGFCKCTCGRCDKQHCGCKDKVPGYSFSCADQKRFGKCNVGWLKNGGYCNCTCGRC